MKKDHKYPVVKNGKTIGWKTLQNKLGGKWCILCVVNEKERTEEIRVPVSCQYEDVEDEDYSIVRLCLDVTRKSDRQIKLLLL